jgi:undecaprenyl pyrophosphate phosphatase UppP
MKEPALLFDTALHAGTLLAVFIYFRKDIQLMLKEGSQFALDLFRREEAWKTGLNETSPMNCLLRRSNP